MVENNSTLNAQNSKLVLGLVGSPRRLGNCEVFIKEISNQLNVNHRLKLIRLPALNILPCNACYGCIMDKPCPNEDDMAFLLSQIVEADAIIMASPIYYLGAHSIFKRILDRGFLFFTVLEKTYGKPCILINTYGIEGRIGAAPHALMTFAAFLGLDIKASINIRAALPGEILMSEEGRQKAGMLAEVLSSDKRMKNEDGCPFCGCEIVRMEQGKFICALCHGYFVIDNQGKTIKIKDGGVLGTVEHMLKHKEWLRGMKDRFLQNKKEIVKTIAGYKDIGEWIK
ncbi:MAG: flavodoxin family protein [Proteobacteria bacterium]|nr:flavodoxin family protein [Pseudomonadota bacterium]